MWIPKHRKRVLVGPVAIRVRDLIQQIAMEHELRILMNSNADSYPFRTLIPIFFERRFRSFLNSSERSNGAWNHHA